MACLLMRMHPCMPGNDYSHFVTRERQLSATSAFAQKPSSGQETVAARLCVPDFAIERKLREEAISDPDRRDPNKRRRQDYQQAALCAARRFFQGPPDFFVSSHASLPSHACPASVDSDESSTLGKLWNSTKRASLGRLKKQGEFSRM